MSHTVSHFTIEELESRFEMQAISTGIGHDSQLYNQRTIDDGSGQGAAYDYYGTSWGNAGSGAGYTGSYHGDGSGNAQLDDGTYTDQSSGSFPAYSTNQSSGAAPLSASIRSFCRICRCTF